MQRTLALEDIWGRNKPAARRVGRASLARAEARSVVQVLVDSSVDAEHTGLLQPRGPDTPPHPCQGLSEDTAPPMSSHRPASPGGMGWRTAVRGGVLLRTQGSELLAQVPL